MNALSLSIYDRMEGLQAIQLLGTAIAKSQMFGCQNESQGIVLATECLFRRTPILSMTERYHLVGSRLTMKYDYMLSEFEKAGGRYEIISRTADHASIKLTFGNRTVTESLTWEEASKEKWPYCSGTSGKLKDNWATPRARRQVMWARVVTEGVRSIAPQVTHGCYAPEEFDSIVDPEESQIAQPAVVDVPFEVKSEPTAPDATATAIVVEQPTKVEPATNPELEKLHALRKQCEQLFVQIGADDEAQLKVLAKRGVKCLSQLPVDQLNVLIAGLQAKVKVAADVAASAPTPADAAELAEERAAIEGKSNLPPDARSASVNDPCSQTQIERLKSILHQWEQSKPGVSAEFKKRFHASGKAKFSDLTIREAEQLEQALSCKNLEAYFAAVGVGVAK